MGGRSRTGNASHRTAQRKLHKALRKLFRRTTCRYIALVLAEVQGLITEEKIYTYRSDIEPSLFAHCSYMGFTSPNSKDCDDYCGEKADMIRTRIPLYGGNGTALGFAKDCPHIVDFLPCSESSYRCNIETTVAKGCPGTAYQRSMAMFQEEGRVYSFMVPIADLKELKARHRTIVQPSELIVKCPVCQQTNINISLPGRQGYTVIHQEVGGFPDYRHCSQIEPIQENSNISDKESKVLEDFYYDYLCHYDIPNKENICEVRGRLNSTEDESDTNDTTPSLQLQ
ncbi:unnamed protein product [Bursaphelenchus okinawaensis]|uniref:Uncharacterized protein n=1 Tax=Bursaphelenchus okinawaensis TaxID=465554 RepID=A0A811KB33_9BILA|nr:unnamed protein product [Bursaphelenchus okinawaensis]CAG9096743.1 unnamed protein product [Bursaphelenchus okinawaensis]